MYVICAYAPTESLCKDYPEQREQFYNQLQQATSQVPSKCVLVVVGDFNAHTGNSYYSYPQNIGKFNKGKVTNNNGYALLDYALTNKLVLTNTLFQHKGSHRTTWRSPGNLSFHQIDYILTRNLYKPLVTNSRSYSGTETSSDHNLVKAEFNLKWSSLKHHQNKTPVGVKYAKISLHLSTNVSIKKL